MPLGLKRYHETGHSHFITFSCYRRMRLLQRPQVCDLFLTKLEQTRVRFSLRVFGYVLMPEHVHLLLSEPDRGTLAGAIHSLKLSVSKRAGSIEAKDQRCPTFAKLTWGCSGPQHSRLWQARYYDRNTRDYEEFREKLRYIHRNPVKRGLCERPEDWTWSSFRHYATGEVGPVEIESEWTARRREFVAQSGK
jgi:REP-associated tyrosine transposase